jgi:hypothetical protein
MAYTHFGILGGAYFLAWYQFLLSYGAFRKIFTLLCSTGLAFKLFAGRV